MGAVPDELEFDRIVSALENLDGIDGVHHVMSGRSASITGRWKRMQPLKALHLSNSRSEGPNRSMLKEEFQIEHATFKACFETDCEADSFPGIKPHIRMKLADPISLIRMRSDGAADLEIAGKPKPDLPKFSCKVRVCISA